MRKRNIFCYSKYICLMICCFIITATAVNNIPNLSTEENQIHDDLYFRNASEIEPSKPINIDDPPFYQVPLPEKVFNIDEVIKEGIEIPLEFIYNNPNWERQVYKEYWHSSYERWSFIPNRIHFAMHRIFATYRIGSVYYDFVHNLGIAEEQEKFKENTSNDPYEYIEVAVMLSEVKNIYAYNNQLILVSSPKRTGLQIINIPTKLINLNNFEHVLIQLVTTNKEEMDFCTITLIKKEKE